MKINQMIFESTYEIKSNHNKFLLQKSSASREWFNQPHPPPRSPSPPPVDD